MQLTGVGACHSMHSNGDLHFMCKRMVVKRDPVAFAW